MPDNYTETNIVSLGSRAAGSLGGIIFGLIFLIAAFPLLWWNEGRSLHRIQTLEEGRNSVISVQANDVIPSNNGKLIFVTGSATTDETLSDNWFGVHENALMLHRNVEMYQWKETKQTQTTNNIGGSQTQNTTYSYTKTWSEQPIDSTRFKIQADHQNPTMTYKSESFIANNVHLGAFKLTNNFVSKIGGYSALPLKDENLSAMNDQLKNYFKLSGGQYVYGDLANPDVGALRISYTVVRPTDVSVVGKQEGMSIQPYQSRNGDIQLLQSGIVDVDSMFAKAEDTNKLWTWLIRLGGFVLMWLGMRMMMAPLVVLGSVVPFLGSIVSAGTGLIAGLFSLVLSFSTIAVAWVFYRPLIGGGLLLVAMLLLWGIVNLGKKVKNEVTTKIAPVVKDAFRSTSASAPRPATAATSAATIPDVSIPAGMPTPSSKKDN